MLLCAPDVPIGELGTLMNVFEFHKMRPDVVAENADEVDGERRSVLLDLYWETRLYSVWNRMSVEDVADMMTMHQLYDPLGVRRVTLSELREQNEDKCRRVLEKYREIEVTPNEMEDTINELEIKVLEPLDEMGGLVRVPDSFDVFPSKYAFRKYNPGPSPDLVSSPPSLASPARYDTPSDASSPPGALLDEQMMLNVETQPAEQEQEMESLNGDATAADEDEDEDEDVNVVACHLVYGGGDGSCPTEAICL